MTNAILARLAAVFSLCLYATASTTAVAQLPAANDAGVSMGHITDPGGAYIELTEGLRGK